jgi:hypothetical protein
MGNNTIKKDSKTGRYYIDLPVDYNSNSVNIKLVTDKDKINRLNSLAECAEKRGHLYYALQSKD